jgi:hypothetical protein
MTLNESLQDRVIRILLGFTVMMAAAVMAMLVPMSSATGIVNLMFLIFGAEVLVTGLIGWSPLYALSGFSTNGEIGA